MDALTSKQLDKNADEFVNSYKDASNDEISKIVAGMTAIIEGNEASYENMKNQKWFERIWYGLTLKNKATVKEMQENRDQLTKYTVKILVKMNNMMNEHGECIYDLYRALAVVRRDLDVVVDEVNELARKLNEKIISIDNYYFLVNEIRNKKFDVNSPLISLIDIMSLIDIRTSKDTKKLIQLKETMEANGFDFSKKIDIQTYSNEILALPEGSVGRILLFCQSFSHRSRFLAYTCTLMENYFYLWESEKRIVRENGEAIQKALISSNLTPDANCIVDEMFSDLKGAIPESFDVIEIATVEESPITPANYYSTKTSESLNVIVAGLTGSGKSTLINAVFDWNVAATGRGQSVTMKTDRYSNDADNIVIYDTVGLQLKSSNNDAVLSDISDTIKNNKLSVIWYCINSLSSRYEDDVLIKLHSLGVPMIIVLTNTIEDDDRLEKEIISSNENNGLVDIPVISVLAKDYVRKEFVVSAFGLEELIDKTINIVFD